MSHLSYNGVSISEPCKILLYDKTAVYNGPDYLYTRHTIHVRGYYNPKAISYTTGPAALPDQSPAITDKSVRKALMTPRKELKVSVDPVGSVPSGNLLVSPAAGYSVDANNGPIPLDVVVREIHGSKTFIVEFAIQTDVNECSPIPSVILSHRWTMEHDIDQDFYTTRIIHGEVICRTDKLVLDGSKPDEFRNFVFHPIPNNFKRERIDVVQNMEGNAVEYTIVDRERPLNIDIPGVSRIEAWQEVEQGNPGLEKVMWAGVGSIIHSVEQGASALEKAGGGIVTDVGADIPGIILGLVTNTVKEKLAAFHQNAPTLSNTINCRVWGTRNSTRKQ